jgi:hypothetical protein
MEFRPISRAFLLLASAALVFVFPLSLQAASESAVEVRPDQEKRSSIVEVDGYAQLSEEKSIKEIRQAAFANARRLALENAEAYIQSKTKVENFVLQYDLIESGAEGVVKVLEQKDLGIENNSRYHVWIKAEVSYALKPPTKSQELQALMSENAPLTVKVWTERKVYKKDEYITINVEGNHDFYGRIVNIGSSGRVIQLLPNAYRQLHHFQGGQRYQIPGPGDRFSLKVTPPFGQERIVVYASETPMGVLPMAPAGSGLKEYRGNTADLAFRVRSIQPVARPSGEMSPTSGSSSQAGVAGSTGFYEASWVVETNP